MVKKLFVLSWVSLFGFVFYNFVNTVTTANTQERKCVSACLPNGFDKVRYGQCYCKADVVVKPMPSE